MRLDLTYEQIIHGINMNSELGYKKLVTGFASVRKCKNSLVLWFLFPLSTGHQILAEPSLFLLIHKNISFSSDQAASSSWVTLIHSICTPLTWRCCQASRRRSWSPGCRSCPRSRCRTPGCCPGTRRSPRTRWAPRPFCCRSRFSSACLRPCVRGCCSLIGENTW